MRHRCDPRLIALVLWFAAAPLGLAADRDHDARSRRTTSQTVLGAPNAVACSQAAASGQSDEAAIKACDRAIEHERLERTAMIATLMNRGTLRLRLRDSEGALADFETALTRDPRNPDAVVNKGAALVQLRRHGEAVAAFTQALQMGPKQPHKAYYNRAAAREALGDLRGALEDYETALAIRPEWDPAEAEIKRFVRSRRDDLTVRLAEDPNAAPSPESSTP